MGDVVEFTRPGAGPAPDSWDGLACPNCGGAWFELGGLDADDNWVPGRVVLSTEGSVTGYSGLPHCAECGTEVVPDCPFFA